MSVRPLQEKKRVANAFRQLGGEMEDYFFNGICMMQIWFGVPGRFQKTISDGILKTGAYWYIRTIIEYIVTV